MLSGISPFDADTAKQVAKNVRKVNYTFEAAWISIIFNHFIHFLFILLSGLTPRMPPTPSIWMAWYGQQAMLWQGHGPWTQD